MIKFFWFYCIHHFFLYIYFSNDTFYDGKTLYQMIRKQEKFLATPVIYLTGEDVTKILVESTVLPDAIVMKSSGKDALIEKIDHLLENMKKEG